MSRATRAAAAVLVPGSLAVLLAAAAGSIHPDGPPPAHTGGFGEPTCHTCHFGADLNEPSGTLAVEGVPSTYAPRERYDLTVRLTRAGMVRAGFQLSARLAGEEGTRSGERTGNGGASRFAEGVRSADGNAPVDEVGEAEGVRVGEQAGTLRVEGERATIARADSTGVQYAQHTEPGTELTAPDTAVWTVEWTAPDTGSGPVVLHIVGNAANHDESAFGDFVYATSEQVPAATSTSRR